MGADRCGGRGTPPAMFVTFYDVSRFFKRNIFGIFANIKWPKSGDNTKFGVGEASASHVCCGAHGSRSPSHFQKRSYALIITQFANYFRVDQTRARPMIFIGEELQVLVAPFWPFLEGTVMGEKPPYRTNRAPLLAGGAPNLQRRASAWAKGAPFRIRRAPLLAGSCTYNFFDAK